MYEWIVDGLTSLFVPFSGEKSAAWPSDGNPPSSSVAAVAVTAHLQPQQQPSQAQEYYRPAKRNYQSIYFPDGISEHSEVKKPRRDVFIRVVKKTFAGIAGLLRLPKHRACHYENDNEQRRMQAGHVALRGIDEIPSDCLSKWTINGEVKMEKQKEMGLTSKERPVANFCPGAQPLIRKPDIGSVLYKANQDRLRGTDRAQRRSLQLLPSGPEPPEIDPPSRTQKPCLTVEQALKESDREHYRKLVEMVSEKYSKNKPLPFGRVKPLNATFSLDGQRAVGRTSDFSKPVPIKVNPHVPVWRNSSYTKERSVASCSSTLSVAGSRKQELSSQHRQLVDVDLSAEVETRLNLKEKKPVATDERTAQTRLEPLHETGRLCEEEFPSLTKEMLQQVSAALAQRDPNLVLSSAFKLRITQRDLATLQEGSWLNDEVINFYFNLVMARSEKVLDGRCRKVYCFSTFFFPKLHGGGHTAVRRWTKAVDLFQYDLILIPLHLGVHWSLAVIDLKNKSVRSYDSMGQRQDDICNLLLMYLKEEYNVKKGKDLETFKWTVSSLRASEIPQQRNGSDCGVFVCKYADYLSAGYPFTFRQCHMPYFRKLMIWEILNQTLLQ